MGSTSTSQSYDLTSGQDAAHKLGQEQSGLRAKIIADLYAGKIEELLPSLARIRDIQRYLRAFGSDPDMGEVIPAGRPQSSTVSHSARHEE